MGAWPGGGGPDREANLGKGRSAVGAGREGGPRRAWGRGQAGWRARPGGGLRERAFG